MVDRYTDEELARIITKTAPSGNGVDSYIICEVAHKLATEVRDQRAMLAGITPARLAAMVRMAETMGRWLEWHEMYGPFGYLAQKAVTAEVAGDTDKAKHHTISTAAALLNWHRQINGKTDGMRPGIIPPEDVRAAAGEAE